jgi:very-short-patch-repair endonuclease
MATKRARKTPGRSRSVWRLAKRQHGVITRGQLREIGFSDAAIRHRLEVGRIHQIHRAVYAVGNPTLSRQGELMAAVLASGPDAVISHRSAAELWQIMSPSDGPIEVSIRGLASRQIQGIRRHRRATFASLERSRHFGIPVTSPTRTLVDLAIRLADFQLEAALSEADKRDLLDPEQLRRSLDSMPGQRGVGVLRRLLDRRTFRLTDSELERSFLRLVRDADLPVPQTGVRVNGFRVDFLWPDLGLVVETDGLRYHRTPAQQARDRRRDQAHTAAGLTTLRFTHAQVRFEPAEVRETLRRVAVRLAGGRVVVRFAGRRMGA